MKQNITPEQILELETKNMMKLFVWCKKKGYKEKLTIGQMIEFLEENTHVSFGEIFDKYWWAKRRGKICDALWEVVKEILNEN